MKTCEIKVSGLVQGVGYRPFVARLAAEYKLKGKVKNAGGIVFIHITGEEKAMDDFIHRLSSFYPKGAKVTKVETTELPLEVYTSFEIVESENHKEQYRVLPADLPVCKDCEKEMKDGKNRRFRYPFISCVACGPRYSILKEVPYDRETITMGAFPMCDSCKKEYQTLTDRRCYAQTIACPDCGPTLTFADEKGRISGNTALETKKVMEKAVEALLAGKILAVKDIGGFHFAFRPDISQPSLRLREFKHREQKPFAVMFSSVEEVLEFCEASEEEIRLLTLEERPIVLLQKKKDFSREVSMDSDRMGVMLPCNPLQMLLLEETGPLVMTSGNRGGEPIIIKEQEMLALMAQEKCPDAVLYHDREIVTPLDDSIYQVSGRTQILRRARGLVPNPILLPEPLKQDTFAAGGDLKSVFALGKGNHVYLSQHFGDLEDVYAKDAYKRAYERMKQLLLIEPEQVAADLHPAYQSKKMAEQLGKDTSHIQHHHAHVASVMAEHHLTGKVLGIAFDGTGFGTDGTIWGSECLLCEGATFERVAHLAPVSLIGGEEGMKNAKTILYGYLANEHLKEDPESRLVSAAIKAKINTVTTSSMGRLFDGAAAALDIKTYNSYEGECAIALEQAAAEAQRQIAEQGEAAEQKETAEQGETAEQSEIAGNKLANNVVNKSGTHLAGYGLKLDFTEKDGCYLFDGVKLIQDLITKKNQGYPVAELALGFHYAIVDMIEQVCLWQQNKLSEQNKLFQQNKLFDKKTQSEQMLSIALCGGTFLNRILLTETVRRLEGHGFKVYTNELVPPGDGGIALGQIYLSALMQQENRSQNEKY